MSPLKRKKLNKIRLKLDKLDNSLIKLIKQRTNLVNQVLKLKDKKDIIPPLYGALLKNEQDAHLFERLAFLA